MEQKTITLGGRYEPVAEWISRGNIKSLMYVCGGSALRHGISGFLDGYAKKTGLKLLRFSDFTPNPLYEEVLRGVKAFRENGCGAILAVGGGSAIDTAKFIRLYCGMEGNGEDGGFLKQRPVPCDIPFAVMPTTAGTGSESTRFAVIYYKGEKQSVTDDSCIPDTVFMDSKTLTTLPLYQRKASMADALCHAVEAFWSVNSTDESKKYSAEALRLILSYKDAYLDNTYEGNDAMLLAANYAGRAINIAETTAGHAMCYKITGLFGCAHGHAAALCDRILFRHMTENTDSCTDSRGKEYLEKTLDDIGIALGCDNAAEGVRKLEAIIDGLGFAVPEADDREFEILKTSVNPERLKNHPISLETEEIDRLYHKILGTKQHD